ncbi:VOC family protein [Enterococcus olivae]
MSGFKLGDTVELATIAIRVKDRDKMIAFYRDLIGFELKGEENALAIMGTAESNSELLWLEESPRADDHFGQVKKLRSFALNVPTTTELADIYARLKKQDYPLTEVVFSSDFVKLVLKDPEGNQLEIDAVQTEKINSEEELSTAATGKVTKLSKETHFNKVHVNANDAQKEGEFLADLLGLRKNSEADYQLDEQKFQISVTEESSDVINIASHEVIGLEILKFFVSPEDLLSLEKQLISTELEFFIDKKKSLLTVYDVVGVEWWFVIKK